MGRKNCLIGVIFMVTKKCLIDGDCHGYEKLFKGGFFIVTKNCLIGVIFMGTKNYLMGVIFMVTKKVFN